MNLHRDLFSELLKWKNNPHNPLILQGARQTGKTWIMKEFGKNFYKSTAYFNFESDVNLKNEFRNSKDPSILLPLLSLYSGVKIEKKETLIIFDEIQECNEALNSLKYFAELAPEYDIICAGSLLGVALKKEGGFPVGQVEFLNVYPLTFKEFLLSSDPDSYQYINNYTKLDPLPQFIFDRVQLSYYKYLVCGGMPKAVLAMLNNDGGELIEKELEIIITSYALDFKKHASVAEVPKITAIWKSLPSQLAKENRKFIYGVIRSGARAREYESSLQWLELAGLIYKINNVNRPALPLSAYVDNDYFKIYVSDIGILRALAQLPSNFYLQDSNLFREFKGAFTENAVIQNLIPFFKVTPKYWVSSGKAEIDFLLQYNHHIIPVEVKSTNNLSGKSLSVYINKYQPEISVIISSRNIEKKDKLLYIPHFLTPWLKNLLDLEIS